MYKIGTDIVKISRIEKSIESPSFLQKVFTEREREYCKKAESFAGIFACKEAYFKAVGTGIALPLTDIEILHDDKGKPYINGVSNCDVSISHDGDYAIATVIIW
ncbi:MAG: holo-ACP synthase [Eubacterium sp.]|nr:holo-ACP synthase [Eubacterium sp.]